MSEHPLSEKKPAQLPYPAEKAEVGLSQRSEVGFIRAGLTQSEARLALSLSALAVPLMITYFFYNFVLPAAPARIMRASAALIPELRLWSEVVSWPLPIPHDGWGTAILLIVLAVVAFTVYGLAIYISWNQSGRLYSRLAVGMAAFLFFGMSVLALPTVNTDIFVYILHGRVAAVHHRNPYYVPPADFPDDPIYPYASPRYTPYVEDKLPTWTWINVGLARLAGASPLTNLIFYRSALMLFNLANLASIAAIVQQLNPRFLLTSWVVYGWNPIVVLYGPSKVDTVMVFFLLLAALFLIAGRRSASVVALGLSVFVKPFTLPLVVADWLWNLRQGRRRQVIVHVCLFALTTLVIYAPFLEDPRLIPASLFNLLRRAAPAAPIPALGLLTLAFLVFALWVGRTQDGSHIKLLKGWALVALCTSIFLAREGLSYYLMMLIAATSLALSWPLALATVALSFFSFLLNSWYMTSNNAFPLPDLLALPKIFVYLVFICLVAVVAAAIMGWRKYRVK